MAKTRDEKERAVATASNYQQGDIAGLDSAMTRRLIASTVLTESNGGRLRITNAQGYVGRYQAGAGWLADAGYIDPGKLKVAMTGFKSEWAWADSGNRDKMDKFLADQANWKDGLSLEKYKNSAGLQDKAFKINCNAATRRAFREGVLHKEDAPEQIGGFLKARHLSGYGGAKAAVTGGKVISDGNGTSNYDYFHDITRNRDGLDGFMSRDMKRQTQAAPAGQKEISTTQISQASAIADGALRQGERGPDVRILQHSLNLLGYHDAKGGRLAEDGKFGSNTKEAVEAFQKTNGLKVDGIVGPKILESIGKHLPEGKVSVTAAITGLSAVTNPHHPDHVLFQQALNGVGMLDAKSGRQPNQQSENIAAALIVEARRKSMTQVNQVMLSEDGNRMFAVQNHPAPELQQIAWVETGHAVQQHIATSTAQLAHIDQEKQQAAAQQPAIIEPQPQLASSR